MPSFTPTAEQVAIINHARDTNKSLIVDAKAGSGKTATLLLLLQVLKGTTSVQAFNRAIANELSARANADLSFEQSLNVSISTCHSHGLSAFRRSGLKPQTLSGKLNFMFKDELKSYSRDDDMHRNARHVVNLTSAMKNSGFGLGGDEPFPVIGCMADGLDLMIHHGWDTELEGDTSPEEVVQAAFALLISSNQRVGSIDFDDMIYLPLLHNLKLPQYDNMLLDEAQDINRTRREMAFRSLTPEGRIIAVGDPNQAIYGFTGADIASLKNIGDRAGASTLPLSICWRCDATIIAEAQKIVPAIQAAPGKPEGLIQRVYWDDAPNSTNFLDLPQAGDAILCRLNKPNVAVALGLIRRGKPARIEGRDLGKRILHHVQKATPAYATQPLAETLLDLETYKEQQLALLFAKKREAAMDMLSDEVDCARLLIERCIEEGQTINSTKAAIFSTLELKVDSLFGDNVSSKSTITLASVHKSKGREWPRVFILGWKDYMPFFRAVERGGWQLEQEYNLQYVAQTRAEHTLVYVNGVASAIDRGLHREAPKAAVPTTNPASDYDYHKKAAALIHVDLDKEIRDLARDIEL